MRARGLTPPSLCRRTSKLTSQFGELCTAISHCSRRKDESIVAHRQPKSEPFLCSYAAHSLLQVPFSDEVHRGRRACLLCECVAHPASNHSLSVLRSEVLAPQDASRSLETRGLFFFSFTAIRGSNQICTVCARDFLQFGWCRGCMISRIHLTAQELARVANETLRTYWYPYASAM
jgi:hypothetical protein